MEINLDELKKGQYYNLKLATVGKLSDLKARTKKHMGELIDEAVSDLYEKYAAIEAAEK